ncbi:MAG: hypothetical protein DMG64_09760 [Acidobacteria bacterium]|nr:MAG: hypothetical protein DMG64_09760 [Acidobacteriota bacterium]PYY20718.1 MAG: hypothetical protein DMG62_22320 [Acidobacteriota bacterium]
MTTTQKILRMLLLSACALVAATGFAQLQNDQIALSGSLLDNGSNGKFTKIAPHAHLRNGQAHARQGVPSIDSLLNWNDHYFAPGYLDNGTPDGVFNSLWYTNMVGNPPNNHGTTYINAPVVPVDIDLRNFDGTPRVLNGKRLYLAAAPFVPYVLASPVFQNSMYSSSSIPTQFTDAVQRAEYYSKAKDDWHTILVPSVKTTRVMTLIRGTYLFGLDTDGNLAYVFVVDPNLFVNKLFPAVASDTTTPVGAAENAGEVTTKDISTFLFPNTFLGNPNVRGQCCILGFHTYDFEPGDDSNGNVEKRYIANYSSWISPGLFGAGFTDITAHSHEIAESFNDPFVVSDGVRNLTPWWLSPNGNCQNDLEDGDVVEGLPNATYPVTLPVTVNMTTSLFTFHPQNEALLQWFQEGSSDAIDHAYSYPNEGILTSPTKVQKPHCK